MRIVAGLPPSVGTHHGQCSEEIHGQTTKLYGRVRTIRLLAWAGVGAPCSGSSGPGNGEELFPGSSWHVSLGRVLRCAVTVVCRGVVWAASGCPHARVQRVCASADVGQIAEGRDTSQCESALNSRS